MSHLDAETLRNIELELQTIKAQLEEDMTPEHWFYRLVNASGTALMIIGGAYLGSMLMFSDILVAFSQAYGG